MLRLPGMHHVRRAWVHDKVNGRFIWLNVMESVVCCSVLRGSPPQQQGPLALGDQIVLEGSKADPFRYILFPHQMVV